MVNAYQMAKTYRENGFVPIPLNGKRPLVSHKDGKWLGRVDHMLKSDKIAVWDKDLGKMVDSKWSDHPLGLIIHDQVVIDFDNKESIKEFEVKYPDLFSRAHKQQTRKGLHLFFKRPKEFDDAHVYNTQDIVHKVDLLTRHAKDPESDPESDPTGGNVQVFPSPGKKWLDGIPVASNLPELPDEFTKWVALNHARPPKPLTRTRTKVIIKKTNKSSSSLDDDQKQLIVNILRVLDGKYCDDYSLWTKVGLGVVSTLGSGSDGKEAFREFSKKSDKYDDDGFERQWNQWLRDCNDSIGLGSFIFWIKSDYPDKYLLLVRDSCLFLNMLSATTYDVAKYCTLHLPNTYYDDNRWYYYNDGFWNEELKTHDHVSGKIMSTVFPDIINGINELNKQALLASADIDNVQAKAKGLFDLSLKLRDVTFRDKVIKEIKTMVKNADFANKLDTNKYIIGFQDAVYDFKSHTWIEHHPDNMITMSTGISRGQIDTVTQEQIDYLHEKVLKRIYPNDELRKFMLDVYAKALIGENPKRFFLNTGCGDNGKGFITRFLNSVFGDYYKEYDTPLLTENKKNSGGTNVEVCELKGARIIFGREPHKDTPINTAVLKRLTGDGDEISARQLYATQMTRFIPQFTMFLECNDKPRLSSLEKAVTNRIVAVPHISKFKDFIRPEDELDPHVYTKDPSMNTDEWRKTYAPAMAKVLLEHVSQFKVGEGSHNKYAPPEVCVAESQQWFNESKVFLEFLDEIIEPVSAPDSASVIKFAELYKLFTLSEIYRNLTKSQKRQTNQKECVKQLKTSKYKKAFIEGRKMINGTSYYRPLIGYKFIDKDEGNEPTQLEC